MARFKTKLVPVGTHHARSGEFKVGAERTRAWVDRLKRMRAAGIRIPVAWGHQPKAEPADEEKSKSDTEYWLSKFNAGHVEDASVEADGTMSVTVDAPGVTVKDGQALTTAKLPDGREVTFTSDYPPDLAHALDILQAES